MANSVSDDPMIETSCPAATAANRFMLGGGPDRAGGPVVTGCPVPGGAPPVPAETDAAGFAPKEAAAAGPVPGGAAAGTIGPAPVTAGAIVTGEISATASWVETPPSHQVDRSVRA